MFELPTSTKKMSQDMDINKAEKVASMNFLLVQQILKRIINLNTLVPLLTELIF